MKKVYTILLLLGALGLSYARPAAAQGEATYKVTFNATWSATTHPQDFPLTPHFSGLIGAAHNSSVYFWATGEPASDGIKDMAEEGRKGSLKAEVNAAIQAGTAQSVLDGGGIGNSPGSRTMTFTVRPQYPLVTLVSMLAPSPDWFVGVRGLSMIDDHEWIDSHTVDLFVYDAGTDSGETFESPNQPTNPRENITRIESGSFLVDGAVKPVGTFIFELQSVSPEKLEEDWNALVQLYKATGGESWTNNTNWSTSSTMPTAGELNAWHGVTVENDRVVSVILNANGLSGTLPDALGKLTAVDQFQADENSLTGSIPAAIGEMTALERLTLNSNDLTGSIPCSLGDLSELRGLVVNDNNLTGEVPPELSKLTNLEGLSIHNNNLSGVLPLSLMNLGNLVRFQWGGPGQTVCAPLDASFQAWLNGIFNAQGPNCVPENVPHEDDWRALVALYSATGDSGWTDNSNWSSSTTSVPTANELDAWYGVTLSDSRVTELDLNNNNLSGALPSRLGDLTELTALDLADNGLTGTLPLSLTKLMNLDSFSFGGQDVCAPLDGSFQAWLNGISDTSGPDCTPLEPEADVGDWLALVALYDETDGDNWTDNSNWSSATESMPTAEDLGAWHGVTVTDVRVTELSLGVNSLAGSLPIELGHLTELMSLDLNENCIDGSIPTEIGNLVVLNKLDLSYNCLEGSIPIELGNLAELAELSLQTNGISGSIPSEFGTLYGLTDLNLSNNELTGTVPAELGDLTELMLLDLEDNALTDTLPLNFVNLFSLETLRFGGQDLCAPLDNAFQEWLSGIDTVDGPNCVGPAQNAHEGDWRALIALYNATGGGAWTDGANWSSATEVIPTTEELAAWVGVTLTDTRVTGLALSGNNLAGELPVELGELTELKILNLENNALTGTLPLSLANLTTLETLRFGGQNVCAPLDEAFQAWLDAVDMVDGPDCAAPAQDAHEGDWKALIALYTATGGAWTDSTNWSNSTASAPNTVELDAWYGVTLTDTRVTELGLSDNNLLGKLPNALGDLTELTILDLESNVLADALPLTLVNLVKLDTLRFGGQALCAPLVDTFQSWLGDVTLVSGPNCLSFDEVIEDQGYTINKATEALILPQVMGGMDPYVYELTPELPAGLVFDNISRTISGTATELMASTIYTYTVRDAHGLTLHLTFALDVHVSPVSVEEESELPAELVLRGNYPNPFNPVTQIVFDLPERAMVTVEAMDMQGRIVLVSPPEQVSGGRGLTVEVNAVNVPSGIYLYRVIAETAQHTLTKTGSMTLIK